ncbi:MULTISPECIES: stalk domain-containing protein [Cohnella]|uniref:stalk domain-containing protein n=1 Tax=Cohnella TaxID=329857 RepID=UPI0009B98A98|nr:MULTISPECIES: stalk domain-containing protein [Cohnella]MBN2980292.1 hypothetical protein [Cohnella algarum]
MTRKRHGLYAGTVFRKLAAVALAGTLAWTASGALPANAAEGDSADRAPTAAVSSADAYRIVVLGDSIGVGYEPGVAAASDVYGYADRLYEQALLHGRAEFANYAILGLKTEGLANQLRGAAERKALPAAAIQDFADPRIEQQAEAVAALGAKLADDLAQADLVAITIGGNDFLAFVRDLLEKPAEEAARTLNAEIESKLNNYAEHAETAVRLVRELAPNAVIHMSDQYLPFPRQANPELYDLLIGHMRELSADLDELAAKLQAENIPLNIVRVSSAFTGFELSFTHVYANKDIHPNQNGYNAIAKTFSESIWNEYAKLSAANKGSAASPAAPAIYIKGKLLATANKPKLRSSTTFLSLRDVADATGAQVDWNAKTQTALFKLNGREVAITIGSKTLAVNGVEQPLAAPAYLEAVGNEKKTYVPLAAIANGLNYQVVYRPKLYSAFINP